MKQRMCISCGRPQCGCTMSDQLDALGDILNDVSLAIQRMEMEKRAEAAARTSGMKDFLKEIVSHAGDKP